MREGERLIMRSIKDQRAGVFPGPRRKALPSIVEPLAVGSIQIVSAMIQVILIACGHWSIFAGLTFLATIGFLIASVVSYKERIIRRREIRQRNYEKVRAYWTDHHVVDLVPPSPELAEREKQWAEDYERLMAIQEPVHQVSSQRMGLGPTPVSHWIPPDRRQAVVDRSFPDLWASIRARRGLEAP